MSDNKEYEVEIEFEGRVFVTVSAKNADEAKEKAKGYNLTAAEVRERVESFTVDPWDKIEDQF